MSTLKDSERLYSPEKCQLSPQSMTMRHQVAETDNTWPGISLRVHSGDAEALQEPHSQRLSSVLAWGGALRASGRAHAWGRRDGAFQNLHAGERRGPGLCDAGLCSAQGQKGGGGELGLSCWRVRHLPAGPRSPALLCAAGGGAGCKRDTPPRQILACDPF